MKKVFLAILILAQINCKGQVSRGENIETKNNNMEYFDINKYKNLEIDKKYSPSSRDLYFKDGKLRIQIFYFNEDIKVEETNIESAYKQVKVYLKSNNMLLYQGVYFYNFQTGIDKEYDEKGSIKKETNHDLKFKITIDDLAKIMKEKYNIDIYNVQKIDGISRFIDSVKTKLPLYEIYSRDETKLGILNCYILNGNTGEVLFTTTRIADTEEKQGSLYDKFIKSYKEKK